MHVEGGSYSYALSILKSNNGDPAQCNRFTFAYSDCVPGEGHFIHTYMHDGDPLPSFEGEPKLVAIPDDMDAFTDMLWNSLNEDNKVSLFVRYITLKTEPFKPGSSTKTNKEDFSNERAAVKVRMQPQSETVPDLHDRRKRTAHQGAFRTPRIHQLPGCLQRLAAGERAEESHRPSGSHLL